MTDNRTNEPTEARTGQMARAIYIADSISPAKGADEWDTGLVDIHAVGNYLRLARAALVAAQGAAPQAAKDIHEPSHDRVYCVRCGGNWPCQAPQAESGGCGKTIHGAPCEATKPGHGLHFVNNAAPVLPSSTVDEFRFTDAQWLEYQSIPMQGYSHRGHLEHVFNEWLKEQGRGHG